MIKLFFIALPIFFAIDLVWLGLIAKSFYRNQIGFLLADKPNWWAAILFYIIFLIGLTIFVISPAVEKNSLQHAAMYGALFGVVTYAAYDLTNLALTKNWPLTVTVVDMIWGAVLASMVASLTFIIASKL